MKKFAILILTVIVIITLSATIILLINNSDDIAIQSDALIFANEKIGAEKDTILHEGSIYVSKDFIEDNELLDFYWDKDYNKISIFKDYEYHKISYNIYNAIYNEKTYDVEDILLVDKEKLYLNIDFLSANFINDVFIDKNSNIVIIEDEIKEYVVMSKTAVKSWKNGNQYEKLLNQNDKIYVYDFINSQYILCKSIEGTIGFVNCKDITPTKTITEKKHAKQKRQESILLTWDLISKKIVNFKPFDIPDMIDIIAPTWYDLKDDDEYFIDISTDDYIKYVQDSGKKIWATFNNSFDTVLTNKLLNNAYKRSKIVDRILEITKAKNYDGINIDFENVFMKDRDVYSVFIKELYCKAKKDNILISVDVAILSNSETWSKFLDRKAIGKYSDYVILMAYDENVSGNSGSVSSIPWIEYGVTNILESVFEGKVVMAVPFYTRLWEETILDGNTKVKATSLRISSANKVISDLGIELEYDEITGQNYGEKVVDGIKCRIWNEDVMSLSSRINIIRKYNLVGKAVWAFDFGTEEMWELLR